MGFSRWAGEKEVLLREDSAEKKESFIGHKEGLAGTIDPPVNVFYILIAMSLTVCQENRGVDANAYSDS